MQNFVIVTLVAGAQAKYSEPRFNEAALDSHHGQKPYYIAMDPDHLCPIYLANSYADEETNTFGDGYESNTGGGPTHTERIKEKLAKVSSQAHAKMPQIKEVGKKAGKAARTITEAVIKDILFSNAVNVYEISKRAKEGKLPTPAQAAALLSTIPGLNVVGQAVEIGTHAFSIARKIKDKGDGSPRSCWVRWSWTGKSVRWDRCPQGTSSCGRLLCIKDSEPMVKSKWYEHDEGESCTAFAVAVSIDAIKIGVNAVGQNYIGAISAAMSLADDLAYPLCPRMKNGAIDYWLDEDFVHDDDRHHYEQQYAHGDYHNHYDQDYVHDDHRRHYDQDYAHDDHRSHYVQDYLPNSHRHYDQQYLQ